MTPSHSLPRSLIFLIAFSPFVSWGCVEGHVHSFVKYSPDEDAFRCLQVYTNLHAKAQKDLDHLEALWKRRDTLIINPAQWNIFGVSAFERKDKHNFYRVSLGQPSTAAPELRTTRVDLDSIKILPGTFYLNKHGCLSYYQQSVVPGKTVDVLLKETLTPTLVASLVEEAEKQLALANKPKVKRLTWAEVRPKLVTLLLDPSSAQPEPQKDGQEGDIGPFDATTLRLLSQARTDQSVKLSRKRDVFTVQLPLSAKDSQEVVATFDLLRTKIAERLKAGQPVANDIPQLVKAVQVRANEAGLEIVVDSTRWAQANLTDVHAAPRAEQKIECLDTVTAMQKRNIMINNTLAIDKIVADYVDRQP